MEEVGVGEVEEMMWLLAGQKASDTKYIYSLTGV